MRRLVGIVAGTGVFLGAVTLALAGGPTDPRPGDALLGKSGGVAYVSDPEFAAAATFVGAAAACPELPSKWRLAGGGFELTGGADATQVVATSVPSDLENTFGDDDKTIDDWWRVSAGVSIGTTVTSYAVCTKWSGLKYKNKAVPDSPSGERSHIVKCGRGKVSGGGGSISTSDSYVSSMFPRKRKRWKFSAFDTAGGIGGMNNYVICARGRSFQTFKDEVSVPAGGSSVLLAAECFPGQSVVGGGAKSSGAPGTLSLRASQPYDTADADSVPSNGWAVRAFSTDPGVQTLKVYAICHGLAG
jgi:hypothetical protein